MAEDILKGEKDQQDGYVASGGTEANLQAVWIYRNLFMKEHGAGIDDIAILGSEDCHYSVHKASDILNLKFYETKVNSAARLMTGEDFGASIDKAQSEGKKYFICFANMMTTMFGSVDDIDMMSGELERRNAAYKIHVDGAYGGFVYPFSCKESRLDFSNPAVSSITLDAHKMVQAPFGTGIFLVRKGLMKYVYTEEAQYVQGLDATVIGSRSGANAIAVWMILMSYGPHGWFEKIHILQYRTDWLCNQLRDSGIAFYRQPYANQVAIDAKFLNPEFVERYGLVPDTHDGLPHWFKIVVMEHVIVDLLEKFIQELDNLVK